MCLDMAHRKTDGERGRFGSWAYNTRIALDLSVEQVMPMLPTTYHPATLRKIEGGSTPVPASRMWRELGNLYSRLAEERHVAIDAQPSVHPEAAGATEPTEGLIAALARQTDAIMALVAEMREGREKEQDVASAIFAALAVLRPDPTPGGAGGSTTLVSPSA